MTVATQAHTFSYAGLTLSGQDGDALWTVTTAPGWHDSPPIRSSRQMRAAQNGEWQYSPLTSGRVVTLQGLVFVADLLQLEEAARRLAGIPAVGTLSGSSVFGDLSAEAMLEDAPQFRPINDTSASWQVTVVTADPLLYGPANFQRTTLAGSAGGTGLVYPLAYPLDYGVPPGVTPGALTLTNSGTRGYWPRLRIDGPVPNPKVTLVDTGDTVAYRGTVAAGQWLDIDCQARRVLLNGQVSVRNVVDAVGNWLAVPPGGASITWTADAADPAASLSVWGYEGAWA